MTIDYRLMFDTVATIVGFIFPLWPLAVIAPMQRRRNILVNMIVIWFFMAAIWLVSMLSRFRVTSWLIPEPFNTILFLVTGVVLVALQFGTMYWKRHR